MVWSQRKIQRILNGEVLVEAQMRPELPGTQGTLFMEVLGGLVCLILAHPAKVAQANSAAQAELATLRPAAQMEAFQVAAVVPRRQGQNQAQAAQGNALSGV